MSGLVAKLVRMDDLSSQVAEVVRLTGPGKLPLISH